mmetsp:Transcript_29313/g.75553  ORF Transcript_29313/g.75553 Transcript_29313/m.75553 type:complete len:134 (-) Transcript_29313:909-1310(-)
MSAVEESTLALLPSPGLTCSPALDRKGGRGKRESSDVDDVGRMPKSGSIHSWESASRPTSMGLEGGVLAAAPSSPNKNEGGGASGWKLWGSSLGEERGGGRVGSPRKGLPVLNMSCSDMSISELEKGGGAISE